MSSSQTSSDTLPPPDLDYDPIALEKLSGFAATVGYRITDWREGEATLVLDIRDDHLNRSGILHGGVLMTLLDTSCGYAMTYCPYRGRIRRAMTLSLSASFLKGATSGRLTTIARARDGGRKIVGCSAEVWSADGQLVAMGQGSFRYRSGSETLYGYPWE